MDQTIRQIENESQHYDNDAKLEGRLHRIFTAVLAILAVAAPALVTYQTQNGNPTTAIAVIVVTTVAGAGTALLGVFRWGIVLSEPA